MRKPTRLLASVATAVVAAGTMFMAGALPAQAASSGLWKVDCMYSHSASDDPIVYPGQPGASHLHDFFGNAGTNAYSTYSSMIGVKSTCTHNDTGAYWTPALYRNGKRILPYRSITYYDVGAYQQKIAPFPKNFMMIEGDKTATKASQVPSHVYWGCNDDTQINYDRREPPANCSSQGIMLRVEFPSCWDGVKVAGSETAHMAYPSGGKCPKGYPQAFPRIGFHVTWHTGATNAGTITFSSGNVYSAHVDFWNTWDQATLTKLVAQCSNTNNKYGPNCGHFVGTKGTPGKNPPTVNTKPATTPSGTSSTPAKPGKSTGKPSSGKGAPCVVKSTSKPKLSLTSADSALGSSSKSWASPLTSTAAAIGVGLIILFEGGVLMRRARRRFSQR